MPPRQLIGELVADRPFATPDTIVLSGLQYLASSRGTVLVLHGLGAFDSVAEASADALRRATGFNVLFVDLRGNGRSGGAVGAVATTRQYVDDVATVVRDLKRRAPSGPVVLAGVQAGAGLALRYVTEQGRDRAWPRVDGLVVADPILRPDSVQRFGTGDAGPSAWNDRRLAALTLLDRVGVHAFDTLPVLYQRVPTIHGAVVRRYSYASLRALEAPSGWRTDAQLPAPMLWIVRAGSVDAKPQADDDAVLQLSATERWYHRAAMTALTRWSAQFSADAEMPAVILPYVPVPVKPPTPF